MNLYEDYYIPGWDYVSNIIQARWRNHRIVESWTAFQKFGDHREIQVDVLIQYFPLAIPMDGKWHAPLAIFQRNFSGSSQLEQVAYNHPIAGIYNLYKV